VASPISPTGRGRIGDLGGKLRNSFESLGSMGSKKRGESDGKSEKSLGSTKSLKNKIKELVK